MKNLYKTFPARLDMPASEWFEAFLRAEKKGMIRFLVRQFIAKREAKTRAQAAGGAS